MKKKTNDELVFLPLGGSGEIGMNLNLYGYGPEANREWLVVDVGVTFGDLSTPGVDVIVPDPAFLEGETIRGIVLTHAHEDHIGALGWLWSRMKAPLYATPFTAFLIREKLREAGILDQVKLIEVPLGGTIDLGPFQVTMVTMTHSTKSAGTSATSWAECSCCPSTRRSEKRAWHANRAITGKSVNSPQVAGAPGFFITWSNASRARRRRSSSIARI